MELACSVSSAGRSTLPEALKMIRESGYRAVELDWHQIETQFPNISTAPQLLTELLEDYQLHLCSLNAGAITAQRDDQCQLQVQRLAECLKPAVQLRVPAVNVVGGPRTLENFNALRWSLEALIQRGSQVGCGINLANEFDSRIENANDLAAVFTAPAAQNIGLVLDVGQFSAASVDCLDIIHKMTEQIKLVRVADVMATTEVPLGQGQVEFRALIRCLDDHNYQGHIIYRTILHDERYPARYIRTAYEQLQSLLA